MLWVRVLSAMVGIPLLLLLVYYGGWLLTAATALVSLLGWREFYQMAARAGHKPWFWLGGLGVLSWPVAAYLYSRGIPGFLILVNIGFLAATAVGFILYYPRFGVGDAAVTLWGLLYVGGLFSHLVLIREVNQGFFWVLLAFLITWSNDTAAFFVGRAIGKRKLAPGISPNKTVEGSVGGLVFGTVVGMAALYLFPRWGGPALPAFWAILLGLLLGAAGQLGDLVESAIKRWAGVKDSGALIPGHGGVLDRFDSLLLVLPVLYYCWYFF
ncbi:MAG: phosphatidate cytidylyltransferase [Firmicutes bacterium]|nr:phosphatidate cytidylyltransferase [Bacillota bacterium]